MANCEKIKYLMKMKWLNHPPQLLPLNHTSKIHPLLNAYYIHLITRTCPEEVERKERRLEKNSQFIHASRAFG